MKTENEKYQALGEAILSVVNPKPQEESTQENLGEGLTPKDYKAIAKLLEKRDQAWYEILNEAHSDLTGVSMDSREEFVKNFGEESLKDPKVKKMAMEHIKDRDIKDHLLDFRDIQGVNWFLKRSS